MGKQLPQCRLGTSKMVGKKIESELRLEFYINIFHSCFVWQNSSLPKHIVLCATLQAPGASLYLHKVPGQVKVCHLYMLWVRPRTQTSFTSQNHAYDTDSLHYCALRPQLSTRFIGLALSIISESHKYRTNSGHRPRT